MIPRCVCEKVEVCLELWERYVHYLSVGIANIMTMYNPEVILLGGGISGAGELLLEPVNQKTAKMVLCERSWCPVKGAALGARAGMYGACALAGQEVGL